MPQPVKLSRLKRAHRGLQTFFFLFFPGSVTNLSIQWVLIEILSHTNAKYEKKDSQFQFCTFIITRFQATSWQCHAYCSVLSTQLSQWSYYHSIASSQLRYSVKSWVHHTTSFLSVMLHSFSVCSLVSLGSRSVFSKVRSSGRRIWDPLCRTKIDPQSCQRCSPFFSLE